MSRPRSRFDWGDERGQLAGIEALPFSVLVFVVGSLLVANAWAVVDAKMAVTSAAREGARTYVEAAPDVAEAAAVRAGLDAVAAHGRDPDRAQVAIENPAGGYRRCARVTAVAAYEIPAITLPFIGGFGRGFHVSATHSEVIDPFRDDLMEGGCA